MTVTRLGLQIPSFTYPGVPDEQLFERVAAIATTAEESGFDSVWVMDHFYQIPGVGPRGDPMLEAYTLLGGLAARTRFARLGTMVTGVTYRNPALLAKRVTTLDVMSGGRAILGSGAAWNVDEHRGYGFEFPPVRERMERLELLDPLRLLCADARPGTIIDFGLADPTAHRLRRRPELLSDRTDRLPLRAVIALMLQHHPDRTLPQLPRIPPMTWHDSILSRTGVTPRIPGRFTTSRLPVPKKN
jgi:hypothetical protein